MYIYNISLKNYRNLKNVSLNLKNGINIFYGNNAQGKTNLLEAIYICGTGRSHRTHIDKELINFEQNEAHIKLKIINDDNIKNKIDLHLKKDFKKGIAINNFPIKKLGELFGFFHVVMFSPEDLNLIKKGPAERRRFLDLELCQVSKIYYYNLQQYYKILKQRNNLLKKIIKNNELKQTIFAWDSQFCYFGNKIITARNEFVNKISNLASKVHSDITNNKEILTIKYKPNVLNFDFEAKLKKNLDKDILYGSTSVGPHKDDLTFFINNINIHDFGSQGQQRTAVLSTKLAQINFIKQQKNTYPVLLLDDVLSELDKSRQEFLMESIKNIQVIITCTGVEDFVKNYFDIYSLFNVVDGNIFNFNS